MNVYEKALSTIEESKSISGDVTLFSTPTKSVFIRQTGYKLSLVYREGQRVESVECGFYDNWRGWIFSLSQENYALWVATINKKQPKKAVARKIVNVKTVHAKSKTHTVEMIAPMVYQVTSGASGKNYVVRGHNNENKVGRSTYVTYTCSCEWGQYRPSKTQGRSACSHVQAVVAHLEMERHGRTVSAWGNTEDSKRQHRPVINLGDGVQMTSRVGV